MPGVPHSEASGRAGHRLGWLLGLHPAQSLHGIACSRVPNPEIGNTGTPVSQGRLSRMRLSDNSGHDRHAYAGAYLGANVATGVKSVNTDAGHGLQYVLPNRDWSIYWK
jgi:hypothetical protein